MLCVEGRLFTRESFVEIGSDLVKHEVQRLVIRSKQREKMLHFLFTSQYSVVLEEEVFVIANEILGGHLEHFGGCPVWESLTDILFHQNAPGDLMQVFRCRERQEGFLRILPVESLRFLQKRALDVQAVDVLGIGFGRCILHIVGQDQGHNLVLRAPIIEFAISLAGD